MCSQPAESTTPQSTPSFKIFTRSRGVGAGPAGPANICRTNIEYYLMNFHYVSVSLLYKNNTHIVLTFSVIKIIDREAYKEFLIVHTITSHVTFGVHIVGSGNGFIF